MAGETTGKGGRMVRWEETFGEKYTTKQQRILLAIGMFFQVVFLFQFSFWLTDKLLFGIVECICFVLFCGVLVTLVQR